MAGWRDKVEKAGGKRDCKTLFWTLINHTVNINVIELL